MIEESTKPLLAILARYRTDSTNIIELTKMLISECRFIYENRDDPNIIPILVEMEIITPISGKKGNHSAKFQKLRKIGENADMLMSLIEYLTPEYSILYQVCKIFDRLDGSDDSRLDAIVDILLQGSSRAALTEISRNLKSMEAKSK
jgi:hypothetical protein